MFNFPTCFMSLSYPAGGMQPGPPGRGSAPVAPRSCPVPHLLGAGRVSAPCPSRAGRACLQGAAKTPNFPSCFPYRERVLAQGTHWPMAWAPCWALRCHLWVPCGLSAAGCRSAWGLPPPALPPPPCWSVRSVSWRFGAQILNSSCYQPNPQFEQSRSFNALYLFYLSGHMVCSQTSQWVQMPQRPQILLICVFFFFFPPQACRRRRQRKWAATALRSFTGSPKGRGRTLWAARTWWQKTQLR